MPTNYEVAVTHVEEYLEDCVTRTPLDLDFTAAGLAAYHHTGRGPVSRAEVNMASWWLQLYREVCKGKIKSITARYSIGTHNRGPGAVWHVFTWPDMSKDQREVAAGIFVAHEILATLKEDVFPMLRNIETQFVPAIRGNRINRTMIGPTDSKLDGYLTMLLRFRRDVAGIRPVILRRVTTSLDSTVDAAIRRVEGVRGVLTTL